MTLPLLLAAAALLAAAPREGAQTAASPRRAPAAAEATATLDAMKAEVARSMTQLDLPGHERPYFISYQVIDHATRQVDARYGALFADDQNLDRKIRADVRVGSYQLDNSTSDSMIEFDLSSPDPGFTARHDGPIDGSPTALRNALWLLTDQQYKHALSTYLKKRAKQVYAVPDPGDDAPSFSKEAPSVHVDAPTPFAWDRARFGALAKKLSLAFRAHPEIFDSDVKIDADRQVRYLVSSEGTRLRTVRTIYGVHIDAMARAPDGQLLEDGRDLYAPTEGELPSPAALEQATRKVITELLALRKAPVIDPYTGPALLAPAATGVLFHEAVGHRLEGDRQDDDTEGRTFKGQVGQQILPPFISVSDDPTLKRADGLPLNGHYRYDEQGVPAQKVSLVRRGVLEGFLLSRHMVKGFAHSNGHGRASVGRSPMARMGNLVVTGDAAHARSWAQLRSQLIATAKAQGKPYGLIVEDMTGGNTNTSGSGYQAFKAQPRLVYRVSVATGKAELVRGVELVGTPLTVINKITALGDRPGVFDGYCGAASGYVPVSTVAPAALISEVEMQRTTKTNQRPPILPGPWAK